MSYRQAGDSGNVLYMVSEEHKKPNIIRGSGSKFVKTHSPSNVISKHPIDTIFKTDMNINGGNVFTAPESISSDSHVQISTSEYDPQLLVVEEHQPPLSESAEQVSITEEVVIEDAHHHQSLQDIQDPLSQTEDDSPLMQATIQTDEGNFIIYLKGGQIVSMQPAPTETEEQNLEEQGSEFLVKEQPSSPVLKDEPEEASTVIELEETTHFSNTIKEEQEASNPEEVVGETLTDINSDVPYVMVQLSNGTQILLPASEFNNSSLSNNNSIFLDDSEQQLITINQPEIPSSKKSCSSNSKSAKLNKRGHNDKNSKGQRPSKRVYSGTHQTSMEQQQQREQPSSSVYSNGNASAQQQEQQYPPVIDVKPGPFRFDLDSEETDNFATTDYLSLVIENFQKDKEVPKKDQEKTSDITVVNTTTSEKVLDSSSGESLLKKEETNHDVSQLHQVISDPPPLTEICPTCSFKTSNHNALIQHMARFHKEVSYDCPECIMSFTSHSGLISHQSTHESSETSSKVSCDHCQRVFQLQTTLNMHLKTCSTAKDKEKHFSDLILINENLLEVGEVSSTPTHRRKQAVYARDKGVLCSYPTCYKCFSDNFALMKHKITVHLSVGPFQCDLCSDELYFETKAELLSHIDCHKDGIERPFICSKCKKGFKLESHLIGHMRAHYLNDSENEIKSREQELLTNPDKLMDLVKMSYRSKTTSEKATFEVFCNHCDGLFPNQASMDEHKCIPSHDEFHFPSNEAESQSPMELCDVEIKIEANSSDVDDNYEVLVGPPPVVSQTPSVIKKWRHRKPPCPPKPKPSISKPADVDNKRKRNINDVQNDFKGLSFKILGEGGNDGKFISFVTPKDETLKPEVQDDLINQDSSSTNNSDLKTSESSPFSVVKPKKYSATVVNVPSGSSVKRKLDFPSKQTGTKKSLVLTFVEDVLEEKNLSDDTISSIVNQMRQSMANGDNSSTKRASIVKTKSKISSSSSSTTSIVIKEELSESKNDNIPDSNNSDLKPSADTHVNSKFNSPTIKNVPKRNTRASRQNITQAQEESSLKSESSLSPKKPPGKKEKNEQQNFPIEPRMTRIQTRRSKK